MTATQFINDLMCSSFTVQMQMLKDEGFECVIPR